MKRKSILFVVSIVLVLTLVLVFVACNNDDGSDDNDLPKIRIKEDMTLAEVKEALSEVKSFKFEGLMDGEVYHAVYRTESGWSQINFEEEYCAYFVEDEKYYALYRKIENSVEIEQDYSWRNATDEYKAEYKKACSEHLNAILEKAEFTIKDNKIMIFGEDGETYEIILSDFNKTTLPIDKYFPNYKDLAVEYIEEE